MASVSLLPGRLDALDKKDALQYGAGLIINVPAPEAEVAKVVEEVAQNGMIRGTKEYNKDEYVSGAASLSSSPVFPEWTEGGKVFYKVRLHALDPRNFKDSNDVGTLAVRYVVMGQDETHTVLRIDAIFVEDFRHRVHASDGSVESAEYKDIHDRLESLELMKNGAAQAEREKEEATERRFHDSGATAPLPSQAVLKQQDEAQQVTASEPDSIQDLQKKVHELRQQTQRRVKAAGTALKSAPFHTAASLQTLSAGAEVLIVIATPYWYGVETHNGQHGWILRDDLEELP